MNEEKKINEQELEQVSGGTGDDNGFEAAWAEYTATHCGRECTAFSKDIMCNYGRAKAAEMYAAGKPVECPAWIGPC